MIRFWLKLYFFQRDKKKKYETLTFYNVTSKKMGEFFKHNQTS